MKFSGKAAVGVGSDRFTRKRGVRAEETTVPKGQQAKQKDNKPKLTTAEKQKKKKEKQAKKSA